MNIWQHYKGDLYNVISFNAKDENGRKVIVYEPLYHNAQAEVFTQPYTRWFDTVEHNGQRVDRFRPVDMKEFLKS